MRVNFHQLVFQLFVLAAMNTAANPIESRDTTPVSCVSNSVSPIGQKCCGILPGGDPTDAKVKRTLTGICTPLSAICIL
ncbi:hypothetical protein C8J56DRAFT_1161718 [Mycena floridula]|nr:hypothetical protein C8J56DRAFT_1161718 [Mycena floridula]